MINYKCYKAKELLDLLGDNFRIINQKVQKNFSDCVTGNTDNEKTNKFYITNRNDIQEIEEWNGLWNEIVIRLSDNTKYKLHSNNVNSDDKNLMRIINNNFLSPSFQKQDEYILANGELDQWLLYNGVSQDSLDYITISFKIYPTYIYKNIYEPIIKGGKICGCYGQEMEMTEDKIDMALSDIRDIDMRLKIERVLKSFESKYK